MYLKAALKVQLVYSQTNAHYSKADPMAGKQKPQFLQDNFRTFGEKRTYWDAKGIVEGFQEAGKSRTVDTGIGKNHT